MPRYFFFCILFFALASFTNCGYYTVYTPIPEQQYAAQSYPIRLAVTVEVLDGASSRMSRGERETLGATTELFLIQYFQMTRMVQKVDAVFPSDAELFVTITEYTEDSINSDMLRSRQNSLDIFVLAEYKFFSKYLPGLSRSGSAMGASYIREDRTLTLGDYQRGNSEALNSIGHSIFKDLEELLARLDLSNMTSPRLSEPATGSEDGWQEILPEEE